MTYLVFANKDLEDLVDVIDLTREEKDVFEKKNKEKILVKADEDRLDLFDGEIC
jgi:hypothetical protein